MRLNDKEISVSVISNLIEPIKANIILNLYLVRGLADAINRTNPRHLITDDFFQLLYAIALRIGQTYSGSTGSLEEQLQAFVHILNAMVDTNVCDFPKDKQDTLKSMLNGLSGSTGIECLKKYAKQALQNLPNDETKLAEALRISTGISIGIFYFASAIYSLDPNKLVMSLQALRENANALGEVAGKIKDALVKVYPFLKEAVVDLKERVKFRAKKTNWYDQTRYVEFLIAARCFSALDQFLSNTGLLQLCNFSERAIFQYSLITKLHHIVLEDPEGEISIEIVKFFKELYQDDDKWGCGQLNDAYYEHEKPGVFEAIGRKDDVWMRIGLKGKIVSCLQSYVEIPHLTSESIKVLDSIANSALAQQKEFIQRHRRDTGALPLGRGHTLIVPLSPQKQFSAEFKIEEIKTRVLQDPGFQEAYKTHVDVDGNDPERPLTTLNLVDEVEKFLKEDQRVLVLIGDPGSGKSYLSHFIAKRLWEKYQPFVGAIPLFTRLATLKNPTHQLLFEALEKEHRFTPGEIAEVIKRDFVFILDGYDEIARDSDILMENQLLNHKNQVIITCAPNALPSLKMLTPFKGDKFENHLLKKLYIAPFTATQIQEFVKKHIEHGTDHSRCLDINHYLLFLNRVQGLQALAANPFFLKAMMELLPPPPHNKKLQTSPDAKEEDEIYKELVTQWMQKAWMLSVPSFQRGLKNTGLTSQNLIDEATHYCVNLARALQEDSLTKYDTLTPLSRLEPFFSTDPKTAYLRSLAPLKVTDASVYSFFSPHLQTYFAKIGSPHAQPVAAITQPLSSPQQGSSQTPRKRSLQSDTPSNSPPAKYQKKD